jgi:WD40 repeat protein
VRSVAYSRDGRLIASGSNDQTLKVWDAASGRLIADCVGHTGFVSAVAFSPDSRLVASGAGTIKVWEAGTGRLVADCGGFDSAVDALAFSSDSRLTAAGCQDGAVRAWEARSGRLVSEFLNPQAVHALCFLPGTHLVVSGSYSRTVKISDAETGAQIADSQLTRESIKCIAASPNGRLAASAGVADSILLYDAATARPIWNLELARQISTI